MELTPKSKNKFSLSNKISDSNKHESFIPEESTSTNTINTPIQNRLSAQCESDYSPLYIQQTQETLDQLDVVWDWNSPHSKHKQKTTVPKRPHAHQSPRPVKKHLSNHQIESYDKLKNELEALKHELVESRGNEKSSSKALFKDVKEESTDDLKHLLYDDDSLENEMILQSQMIEEQQLTTEIKNNTCDMTDVQNIKSSDVNTYLTSELKNVIGINYIRHDNSTEIFESEFFNDNMVDICNGSTDKVATNKICSSEEIEQKRLQAEAKLNLKNQYSVLSKNNSSKPPESKEINSNNTLIPADEMSPIKCSPEEINQKRMLALAKLDKKKKQKQQIEKNRREAQRKLEMNKKSRALQNLSNKK